MSIDDGLRELSTVARLMAIVLLMALVVGIRWPLESFLHGSAPYAFLYLPILISAWYWGVFAAAFALILAGAVAIGYFEWWRQPVAPASLMLFAGTCVAMVALTRAAREVRNREERSNDHLASIIRSSDDAIISKNMHGIIQSCNPACEHLFGYTQAELVGRPVTVLIPPELHAQETDILARLARGEHIDRFDTVRVTKDGRRVDVAVTISPIRGPGGKIIGASKIARDITDLRRAQRDLAVQQEWFRVTLRSIGDAVIATDAQGRVTFLNEEAERLTGCLRWQANGQPLSHVFRVIHEKTRQPVDDPTRQVLQTGHVMGLATHSVLVRPDGTECPIGDSAAPIRNDRGEILGVVLVFHDVTAARRSEDALAEQREWFERTLESIGDAVIATDVRCDIVFMNPVAEHLTGWMTKDALGSRCEEVFHIVNERTRTRVDNPVQQVLETGTVVGLANHTVLIARDGRERPIDDSGAPIRNREGRVVGVVLVFRDVSERRRTEVERQATLAERERLLDSERVARSEADRANRVKDDFLAVVSHELRTPLNSILGWIQLLDTASGNPQLLHRGLDVIGRNARAQAKLIGDLLDVSRIVSGKLLLDVEEVNLATVIHEAVQTVERHAERKQVRIREHLDAPQAAPRTAGDPARLQQVVWNLLSNAVTWTPEGGTIDVFLTTRENHVEIAVRDSGIGIRPDLLDRIFDRFYQQSHPTTRRHGGLGLGLSIVRHLVELHGGTVHAWSDGEGRGATFTIVLPHMTTVAAVADLPGSDGAQPPLIGGEHLGGVRILVVEDQADTQEVLERLLASHGAMVTITSNAAQALIILAETRFDLLLSDIGLPDVDGYELIQRIRALEAEAVRGIPAIALTAFTRSEERTRALLAGYHVHLAKPVEPAELLATIASLVGLQRRSEYT